MPDVNTKWVRAFLIQAEERSTSKTARRLGISKAGVLGRIQALEKSAGVPLFERRFSTKHPEYGRTQLTDAGRQFLPKAIEAMKAHERMFAEVSSEPDPREVNRIISTRLMEIALDALRHDLSDEDRDRLYKNLLD